MTRSSSRLQSDLKEELCELVREDRTKGLFKVNRRVFTDASILDFERQAIFDRCWLYLGHVSELPAPGSFLTRKVAGRSLLFNRDHVGGLHAFFNACAHRGASVCVERHGTRRAFQCPYHGWVYDDQGKLTGVPGRESVSPGLIESGTVNLTAVPRLEEFCGFVFINFDPDAGNLETYLGEACDILKLVADQGESGMEIVSGSQEYSIDGNWKTLQENSGDVYHVATTHSTYFDYVSDRDGARAGMRTSEVTPFTGVRNLRNGHVVIESLGAGPWGRPYARWVPGWGDDCREEIADIEKRLVERLGKERGRRVSHGDRNMLIFPNLVINDIMAITIRTFYPVGAGRMEVNAWALAPRGESATSRDRRLHSYVEFFGPAGFASPDDAEMIERCQEGYNSQAGIAWNDLSRGMFKDNPDQSDEEQLRIFWRRWHELILEA